MKVLRFVTITALLFAFLTSAGLAQDKTFSDFFDEDEGWILRDDIPVSLGIKGTSWEVAAYQNDVKLRIIFQMDAPSSKTIKTQLKFDPIYFLIKGMPILIDTATGKKKEVDYEYAQETMTLDVEVASHPKILEFHVTSRKLRNRSELSMDDKMKQARTIRRIRQQIDTWSELADGQIIAQKTLKPIICHAGYDVKSVKTAVVWANNSKLTGHFELIDSLHNRQHPFPQPVVYKGKLKKTGFHIWGGNNYIADFSDFKTPGLYRVRLIIDETKEVVDSHTFPIRKDHYLELTKKAARWFRYQRCGTEVPGFHKACHTGDTIVKLDGTRVDVAGGWHDAGDYGKWIWGGTMGINALTTFQDEFGDILDEQLDGMPRFINEAAWEADYFCRSYWDGGFHASFTPDFEDVCTWLATPENEAPRVVYESDCVKYNYGITKEAAIGTTGALLARIGRQLMPYNKNLSDKCIEVAMDTYERSSKILADNPDLYYTQSGLLLNNLELYEITGERKYFTDAEARVKAIIDLQLDDGSFYTDSLKEKTTLRPGYHMPALYEFANRYPKSELTPEIADCFAAWADNMMQYAYLSPFGQVGGKLDDGTIRNIVPDTNNGRFGETAFGLATAGRLCKNLEYLEAAEYQLQWILGFNPADVSMMADVGQGPNCYHTRYCFMKGCEDGIVPGGITLGIYSGKGELLELGDLDTKQWVVADVPIDYPVIDTDVWGWTYAYRTSEYALAKGSSFMRAACQIIKGYEELK